VETAGAAVAAAAALLHPPRWPYGAPSAPPPPWRAALLDAGLAGSLRAAAGAVAAAGLAAGRRGHGLRGGAAVTAAATDVWTAVARLTNAGDRPRLQADDTAALARAAIVCVIRVGPTSPLHVDSAVNSIRRDTSVTTRALTVLSAADRFQNSASDALDCAASSHIAAAAAAAEVAAVEAAAAVALAVAAGATDGDADMMLTPGLAAAAGSATHDSVAEAVAAAAAGALCVLLESEAVGAAQGGHPAAATAAAAAPAARALNMACAALGGEQWVWRLGCQLSPGTNPTPAKVGPNRYFSPR
jgi:hypothetical protein